MQDVQGLYRLREGVRIQGNLIYRSDPLAVTRVNKSALSLIDELSKDHFRTAEEIAYSTNVEVSDAESLLRSLFERGFLAWNPESNTEYQP
ncbi:hypothetical protein Q5L94_13630, partial [Idiomarina sp. Sol25]|uniref:hypothetical protein n=1 Tax=Idiomarina sp. Sol25 TaxID=3064000 RepID=UPI00294B23FA